MVDFLTVARSLQRPDRGVETGNQTQIDVVTRAHEARRSLQKKYKLFNELKESGYMSRRDAKAIQDRIGEALNQVDQIIANLEELEQAR